MDWFMDYYMLIVLCCAIVLIILSQIRQKLFNRLFGANVTLRRDQLVFVSVAMSIFWPIVLPTLLYLSVTSD